MAAHPPNPMAAHHPYRVGKWLPSDARVLNTFVAKLHVAADKKWHAYCRARHPLTVGDGLEAILPSLHPAVQRFNDAINADPAVRRRCSVLR